MAATSTNYIQHLNAFIKTSQTDKRLTGNHISLYLALFSVWNDNFFSRSFKVNREKLLSISHIGSAHTYMKCMRELDSFGYINYFRSVKNGKPGTVIIILLPQVTIGKNASPASTETVHDDVKSAPSADANMPPYINNTNRVNKDRGNAFPPKNQQKENGKPESLEDVLTYFHLLGQPASEAAKFFQHYEANGWKQGGKVPLENWPAAAQKWILNIHPTQPQKNGKGISGNLHINPNKSYSDPL